MDEQKRLMLLDNINCGLALAKDPDWLPSLPDIGGEQFPEWDCPPISAISKGLRHGFTMEDEEWARRSPDFQRLVRAYWRVKPPSFWVLARFAVEGDRFPFAEALRRRFE